MKKLILISIMFYAVGSFAQSAVKNGTIYKEHPYITLVKQLNIAFAKGDTTAVAQMYADTAKFYDSPSPTPKGYTLSEAKANWRKVFTDWDQITIKQVGYPDGLEYTTDPFTVQSWWTITAVNKKTQKKATFQEVVFDFFNKAGKIATELSYYDTSSLAAAMK